MAMTRQKKSEQIRRVPLVEPMPTPMRAVRKAPSLHDPKTLISFLTEALGGMPEAEVAKRYNLPVDTVKAFANAIPRDLSGEIAFADPTRMFGNQTVPAFNPSDLVSRRGLQTFDRMKSDDQVKAALTFKKLAVMSSGWEVIPPKEKPKDWEPALFIDHCLSNVATSLNDCLMEVMSALDYGFSVSEMVFEPIKDGEWKGKIGLKAIKTRKPHWIDFAVDDYGNLRDDGIIQRAAAPRQNLPLRKFIVFVHQPEFGNPYGRSDLEAAYRPWWIKENAYRWLAMLLERFGIPPIFALYNPRSLTSSQVGELRKVIERLQAATAGALPRVSKDDLEMWAPEVAGQTSTVFIPALQHLNQDIARALLMPGLLGLTADQGIGSLARSKVHFDAFMMTLGQLQGRLSEMVLMDTIISRLMELNYNEQVNPLFHFLEIDDTLRTELMTAWTNLVDKSVVRSQKADEDHVREMMGFPERADDDLDLKGAAPPKNQTPPPLDPNRPPLPDPNAPPADNKGGRGQGEPSGKAASNNPPAKNMSEALLQGVATFSGPEVPALAPFVHAAATPKLAREPNHYEKRVDFAQISRTLDELQSKHVGELADSLRDVRDKLTAWLKKNYDGNAITVRALKELRGMAQVRKAINNMLDDAYGRGRKTMAAEIAKGTRAKKHAESHQPNYKPGHAISYLRTKADFTVSGINGDLTKQVQQRLLTAISTGEYIEDTIRKIQDDFEPYVGDPNVIRDGEQIEPWRVETIVRTNLTDAFNQGRIVEARQAGDYLDAFEWSSILDSKTTEVCQYLDGMLFRPDDQWLDILAPPRHFNCRSILVGVPVGDEIDEEDFITDGEAGKAQDLSGEGFTAKTEAHRYHEHLKAKP